MIAARLGVPMRTLNLTILGLSSLLLGACTGAGDDSSTNGNGNGNAGNGGDNGGGGGGCGDYMPAVHSTLSYAYTNMGATTGTYEVTFTSYDAGTGDAVFTSTSSMASSGYSATSTTVQNLRCESDGVYAVSVSTDSDVVSGGTPFSDSTQSTYDPPYLVIPADLAAGSTWHESSTATNVDAVAGTSTTTVDLTGTAGSAESVTVPAGTYDTLPVTYTPPSGTASHSWLAVGVGAVQTDYSELTSVQ